MKMNAWQIVVRALEAEGIPFVFGLPGNPTHLYDQLYDSQSVRPVLVRHETSGSFMAMAYARVSGQVGCCFGCPGPGVANLVPGILEAYSGCAPVLALGVRASRKTEGMGAFQETDHLGMMRPITKWAVTLERADRIGWTIRRAISIATSGKPGPVYVEIPADIALEQVEMPDYIPSDRSIQPAPDPDKIEQLLDLLEQSKRPVIVCGGGNVLSRAFAEVQSIADGLGIPILVTPAGRGIIAENHPLFAGSVGLYRTEYPRSVYQEADLLITVGSRMEEFQSGIWHYFPTGARFVQIDIDPFEIGRNWIPDVAIQSDAAMALRELLLGAMRRELVRDAARINDLVERRDRALQAMVSDTADDSSPIKGKRIVREINEVFGANTILALENGGQDLWAYYWPYYQVLDTNCVVPPAEQTVMGLGICGAIAAKLAHPERQVVCTTGDGAFQMAMHELPTAVQEGAPVTWVIFNDGALGWPQLTQREVLGGRIIATNFTAPFDFVQVAHAAGCWATHVDDAKDLRPALLAAQQANRDGQPAVVDVRVDPIDHHAGFIEYHELR
jgi:acetolactate synthase I/II/III large subunit